MYLHFALECWADSNLTWIKFVDPFNHFEHKYSQSPSLLCLSNVFFNPFLIENDGALNLTVSMFIFSLSNLLYSLVRFGPTSTKTFYPLSKLSSVPCLHVLWPFGKSHLSVSVTTWSLNWRWKKLWKIMSNQSQNQLHKCSAYCYRCIIICFVFSWYFFPI